MSKRRSPLSAALVIGVTSLVAPGMRVASASPDASRNLPRAGRSAMSRAIGGDQERYLAKSARGAIRLEQPAVSVRLSADGARVTSRGRTLSFSLTGFGREGSIAPVPSAAPDRHANRVEYRRNDLVEWYVNGPAGIEQGFTVAARPAGNRPLQLEMSVEGARAGDVSADGRSATWTAEDGGAFLRYAGLFAADADGRELPARLAMRGAKLTITVEDDRARYPVTIDPFFAEGTLTASDGREDDDFGFSVAISGDTIVAGAPFGNSERGAAYVFVKPAAGWESTSTFAAKLTVPGGLTGDQFGYSVAISGDTIVVAAPQPQEIPVGPGAAYVFVKPISGWKSTAAFDAKLTASGGALGDRFGHSVAISGDTVVAGAFGVSDLRGAAYVFVKPISGWATTSAFEARLTASDGAPSDLFGSSVAISGDTVIAGAPSANNSLGAAYVFVKPVSGWATTSVFAAKLSAPDTGQGNALGASVAIFDDTVVAGAPTVTIDHALQGAVYVFVKPGTGWASTSTFDAMLAASDGVAGDQLGSSIAISEDSILAGAPAPGRTTGNHAVYVFVKPVSGWVSTSTFDAKLTSSDASDSFSWSVAISDDTAVVGAPEATIGSTSHQGAAHLFGGFALDSGPRPRISVPPAPPPLVPVTRGP